MRLNWSTQTGVVVRSILTQSTNYHGWERTGQCMENGSVGIQQKAEDLRDLVKYISVGFPLYFPGSLAALQLNLTT